MTRVEYRDHWLLSVNAAMVLRNLESLLAHPTLDIAPSERERYEADCAALSALLPSPVRMEEYGVYPSDPSDCPF